MRTIYKYPLIPVVEQTIQVPLLKTDPYTAMNIKQQILKLDVQGDMPCLWIMVDSEERKRDVKVTLCGTGCKCCEPIKDYIDSFQVQQNSGANFVFHVFVREHE
jgi:hypothetical protein